MGSLLVSGTDHLKEYDMEKAIIKVEDKHLSENSRLISSDGEERKVCCLKSEKCKRYSMITAFVFGSLALGATTSVLMFLYAPANYAPFAGIVCAVATPCIPLLAAPGALNNCKDSNPTWTPK